MRVTRCFRLGSLSGRLSAIAGCVFLLGLPQSASAQTLSSVVVTMFGRRRRLCNGWRHAESCANITDAGRVNLAVTPQL